MEKEELKQEDNGITIVEYDGKLYFSDEVKNNNFNHPLNMGE